MAKFTIHCKPGKCNTSLIHITSPLLALCDHSTEVRETGRAGLDASAEAELKRRRDEIAVDAGTTREKQTKQTSLRPDVDKKEFVNTVEQVVPVIERDIYVPTKSECCV